MKFNIKYVLLFFLSFGIGSSAIFYSCLKFALLAATPFEITSAILCLNQQKLFP